MSFKGTSQPSGWQLSSALWILVWLSSALWFPLGSLVGGVRCLAMASQYQPSNLAPVPVWLSSRLAIRLSGYSIDIDGYLAIGLSRYSYRYSEFVETKHYA